MSDPALVASSSILFRHIRPEDAEQLRDLRHRAIQECAHHFGTPPDIELGRGTGYYRRQILEGRRLGSRVILGGWVGDELICMAGIRRRRTVSGPVGLITSMYVAPDWRGRRAGGHLLAQARERIEKLWKVHRFQMNVEVNNETALKLYLRNGFRICSREENAFFIRGRAHSVYLLECP